MMCRRVAFLKVMKSDNRLVNKSVRSLTDTLIVLYMDHIVSLTMLYQARDA